VVLGGLFLTSEALLNTVQGLLEVKVQLVRSLGVRALQKHGPRKVYLVRLLNFVLRNQNP